MHYTHEFNSGWSLQPGIRHSATKADLRRFYEKNNDDSTLFDPKEKKYQEIIGSLRATKRFHDELFFFGGFSQDLDPHPYLTSTDETSAVEKPNTTLEPERFLQMELGMRGKSGHWIIDGILLQLD